MNRYDFRDVLELAGFPPLTVRGRIVVGPDAWDPIWRGATPPEARALTARLERPLLLCGPPTRPHPHARARLRRWLDRKGAPPPPLRIFGPADMAAIVRYAIARLPKPLGVMLALEANIVCEGFCRWGSFGRPPDLRGRWCITVGGTEPPQIIRTTTHEAIHFWLSRQFTPEDAELYEGPAGEFEAVLAEFPQAVRDAAAARDDAEHKIVSTLLAAWGDR